MSSDASATYIVAGSTGPVGPQGPQGERGLQGDQGNRGATGPIGPRGGAGTITVGTTTTLQPTGTDQDTLATATVTNVGTSGSEAVLNFGIPSGIRGPKGDPGTFSANSSDPTVGTTFSIDASNGNTFIAGTLDVSKNVSFFSDLDVSGNVDVSGNLTVDGSFTLSNGTDSGVNTGALIISGGLYVGKKIYAGRKLTVATEGIDVLSGDVTMSNGNLDVTGSSTLRGNTSITDTNTFTVGTGATNLGGSLTVTGDASFNAGLTVNSDALDNALIISNTTGDSSVGGDLVINGNVVLGGGSGNTITAGGRLSSNLIPNVDATYDLGSATLGWNDLHLGSGGVINFGNSNASITHSNNTFTLNSGSTLAAQAITCTTLAASSDINVPLGNLISFNANADTNEAIYGDGSYLYLRSGGTTFRVPSNITTDYFLKTDASGNLSWGQPVGGQSNSSTNATNFQVTNDTSDTEAFPVFVNEYTGFLGGKVDYGKLKYNAVTGTVTANTFSGNLALSNVTGLGTNVATFLATPNSANLASAVTEGSTGTGALVFATSPTLVSPALGTPDSGNLSSCTDYPTSSLSGTITNAQLAGSIADTKLSQITTASKVAGSAVQLATNSAITNSTGLTVTVDNSSIENDSGTLQVKALGITNGMLAGTIADGKLSQITTSDKVSGSAIQLQTNKGISDNSGLGVTVDDSSIEIHSDGNLRVKALGITNAMLGGSIADTKLSTITTSDKVSGSAIQLQTNKGISDNSGLGVTVDDGSIEIHSDGNLRVKALGITNAMLAGSIDIANKVTGTLPVGNGGTGQTTYADGELLIGNSSGTTLAKSTLTAGDGISITNGNGSISIANGNGVVTAFVTASSSTKIQSGAMSLPAGSIIKSITAVTPTGLTLDTTVATTIKVGKDADTNDIAAAVDIAASGTVAIGTGTSTDSALATGLNGEAPIVFASGGAYETTLHITVENSGNITAGSMSFAVEYITLQLS